MPVLNELIVTPFVRQLELYTFLDEIGRHFIDLWICKRSGTCEIHDENMQMAQQQSHFPDLHKSQITVLDLGMFYADFYKIHNYT